MIPSDDERAPKEEANQFATTQWSLVLIAGTRDDDDSQRALEKLCGNYWPPLYAYACRRLGDEHQAQDLTQAFFAKLLEKHYLGDASPDRGRFRCFLITAFKRFLCNEREREFALKRGGGRVCISLDFDFEHQIPFGQNDSLTADRIYERQWAITLLGRVMQQLQREMERKGKGHLFEVLKDHIGGEGQVSFSEIAPSLGLTEPAARMAASRMRQRYRERLCEELSHTVANPEDIDDEVRHLFRVFEE